MPIDNYLIVRKYVNKQTDVSGTRDNCDSPGSIFTSKLSTRKTLTLYIKFNNPILK